MTTGHAPRLPLSELALDGELHAGETMRRLYATDASEFQEMPAAVAFPRTEADVVRLIRFATRHRIGLIPHPVGTVLPIVALTPAVTIPLAWWIEGDRPGARSLTGTAIAIAAAAALAAVSA